MRVIDRIVQARKATRRPIQVPEWPDENGDPTTLYFGVLTHADVQAVRDRLRDGGKDPEHHREEERALLLVSKAEMEDGSRAFEYGDLRTLQSEVAWATYNRLLTFMYQSSFPETSGSLDEAKKKSLETTSSDSDSPSEST